MTASGSSRRFEILSSLGSGSMGSVYRARDVTSGRVVALKTAVVEDHAQLESLRAETAALARLAHPGIVPIVGHGVEEGVPYLAMELIDGTDLATALLPSPRPDAPVGPRGTVLTKAVREASAAPRMSSPEAIALSSARLERIGRIVVRLARTLAYLHGEGVVHRDLKPENVLLVGDDRPVLVDFGLARFRFGRGRERVATDRGASGTPYYMSPEQIENQLVDARTDLYALGALLHHLVAGAPPFVADDLVGLLSLHLVEAPPRLSTLVPGVPACVEDLVIGLLEKDRARRIAYAEDVVDVFASIDLAPPVDRDAPPPRPYVYGSACVGRRASEGAFGAILDGAPRATPAIALVGGESGVGKSRFLSECLARVPVDVTVCAGAAPPRLGDAGPDGGDGALAALRPLLRWLADHAKVGHTDDVARWIGDGGALLALYQPELAELVDPSTSMPLPRADAWNGALARALVAATLRVSRDVPIILVVDDAQWADAATAEFVTVLATTAVEPGHQLVVVVGYRSEATPPWIASLSSDVRSERLIPLHAVPLHPLDAAAMRDIAAGMLGASGRARESRGVREDAVGRALDRVAHAAQGNPFTLAEAIRAAVEDGSLVREGRGRWTLATESRVVDLLESETLSRAERVAEARIAVLGERTRRIAGLLAAIARPASIGLLTRVIDASAEGKVLPWELAGDLHELVVRGIACETSAGAWSLAHDKLRERCYAALDDEARRRAHRAIADALRAEAPAEAEALVALARHAHLGGDALAAASDALRAADVFEARTMSRETEESAELAWSFVRSEERRGAAVDRIRGLAAARLGGLRASNGKLDEAAPLLDLAVELGGAVGDARALAIAHVGLGYVAYLRGQEEALFRHASAAVAAAAASRDDRLVCRAENTLGIAFGSSGSFRQAIHHYTRAAELAERVGDRASMGKHWSNISINHRLLGDLAEARAAAERAISLTTPSPTAHANAWANLGRIFLELGAFDDADRALERAIAIAQRIGVQFVVAEAEWGRAMVHVALGEPHVAAHHASVALEVSVRTGLTVNEGMARRAEARIAGLAGDTSGVARAITLFEQAISILEGTQEQNELADCLVDLADALERSGDAGAARAARKRARETYARLDMRGRLRETARADA